MVTLSKIIERLEMVDDIVDCYYNLHKFKEMAEISISCFNKCYNLFC